MHPDRPRELPLDFAELEAKPPAGLQLSDRVLDPMLFVVIDNGELTLKLGARQNRKGETRDLLAPALGCNWVIDGDTVYPLPADVTEVVSRVLEGVDPARLSFAQAIELSRRTAGELPVVVDPQVLQPANQQSEHLPQIEVPGLNATLFAYQARGVAWTHQMLSRTGGVIIADEMGLGKTIQIIGALLLDLPTTASPALIICPTTLIANWAREISRFAPGLDFLIHRGTDRARLPRQLQRSRVLITTYDTLVNDLVLFKAIEWNYVICDEAQAIKNPDSQRRKAVSELQRRRTIPVTGTPVENSLLDLWSLVDIAVPGFLGDRHDFELAFADDDVSARELARLTNPLILKRRVKDVAQDLPERLDVEVPVELGSQMDAQYEAVRTETLARYPIAGGLVATGQLSLFCAHPWLVAPDDGDEDTWEDRVELRRGRTGADLITPKMERATELIGEAFANNRKVLLFANYNAVGPLLKEAGRDLPQAFWGAINGSTPSAQRQVIVDRFTNHDGPAILVLNPRAAGAGLNITAATVVIHYTQVWNPALELQASARAHRRGQTQPVTVYHMFYVDTVEEVMMQRARRRRELGNEAVPVRAQEKADLEQALRLTPVGASG